LGVEAPLGPVDDHDSRLHRGQGCSKPRRRRCLLKGCEEWFQPRRPQARYCSQKCRESAKRWRRWRAGQKWRKTESGRHCRRQQSCRYRQRVRERREAPRSVTDRAREGQRPADILKESSCSRPGCYDWFVTSPRSPGQRFCSYLCRKALRRVLQRESRWATRRKPGPRLQRRIPP